MDIEQLAGPRKISRDSVGGVGEDFRLVLGHGFDDLNGLVWQIHLGVVAVLLARMLHVAHQYALVFLLKIVPDNACDLLLTTRREESENDDLVHRHGLGGTLAALDKMSQQLIQLLERRSSITLNGARGNAHAARYSYSVFHLLLVEPIVPHGARDSEDRGRSL